MEYRKITAIRRVKGRQKVYNFSVPGLQSYVANGIVVHNCQNFTISQSVEKATKYVAPEELVQKALDKSVRSIAFTFNEPSIHYEYVRDVAEKKGSLKVVVKTNGFALPWVWDELKEVDAFNVDIKGDTAEYQKVCGGSLEPVLDSIQYLFQAGKHVEISYLVLPRQVEDWNYHRSMRDFISGVADSIPIHLLYFYPFHQMQEGKYDPKVLCQILEFMKEKMKFVYISNLYSSDFSNFRDTKCPSCNGIMVSRQNEIIINQLSCCGFCLSKDF